MTGFTPSRDEGDAERALVTLITSSLDPQTFAVRIRGLRRISSGCHSGYPPPWPALNLLITPEITCQSELWLPLAHLRPHFQALYRRALTYPPILSSTPFARHTSWAGIVSGFPQFIRHYSNPSVLFEQLVLDAALCRKFLFWSFMPGRFYGGGSDRYPWQSHTITEWLAQRDRRGKRLRCLDAACGDGEATYALARLLDDAGWPPDRAETEGWTLEPLEAWSAAYGRFPHDPAREAEFMQATRTCFETGRAAAIRFNCIDLLNIPEAEPFDLILCNGLLGGPIIHSRTDLESAVRNLAALLAPGGMLLAADHFHGGWKQKCPQQELRALFEINGLRIIATEEGLVALAPHCPALQNKCAHETISDKPQK